MLGPLGEVLGKDAVFTPVGGHASIQLKLKLIDTTEAVNLELATAQPFTIRDLAPGAYDYQFCLTLTERPGMVFSRQFTVLADDDAAGLSPDAPIDSLEAIQLAMSLLEQGLLYDAWLILAELQVEEKDVTILPLVHSLHDRVSDTLLKRGKSQKQQN